MNRKKLLRNILSLIVAYVAVCAGIYFWQDSLMYHPDRLVRSPTEYSLSDMLVTEIPSTDEVRLQLWYKPAEKGQPTVVYFHGNGGHLGYRHVTFRALLDAGFGLVAVDWRGYGASTGRPSEAGIIADAHATLRFAEEKLGVKPQNTILFGESLGSGVAVQVAATLSNEGNAPALVVLQAPYTSVAERAAEIYFYLPVKWLIKDRYESRAHIAKVKSPILILHGDADRVIPIEHGKALLAAANEPKKGMFYEGIDHFGFPLDSMVAAMREMIGNKN
jgi:fermentation-respiration switch protein FrsA (DUF1100 family)